MAVVRPFREDFRTEVPMLRGIVRWMNEIGHVLNNLHFTSGDTARVMASKSGIKFVLPSGVIEGSGDWSGSFGFKITAVPADESAAGDGEEPTPRGVGDEDSDSDDEPEFFDVKVLGGPAQVLGGEEHLFKDEEFEDVKDGTVFYVRYVITDEDGEAVCEWDKGFQRYEPPEDGEDEDDENNPFIQHGKGRALTFVIGVVSADYEDNVRQDRVGSIMAVATINASGVFVNPDAEEL